MALKWAQVISWVFTENKCVLDCVVFVVVLLLLSFNLSTAAPRYLLGIA